MIVYCSNKYLTTVFEYMVPSLFGIIHMVKPLVAYIIYVTVLLELIRPSD